MLPYVTPTPDRPALKTDVQRTDSPRQAPNSLFLNNRSGKSLKIAEFKVKYRNFTEVQFPTPVFFFHSVWCMNVDVLEAKERNLLLWQNLQSNNYKRRHLALRHQTSTEQSNVTFYRRPKKKKKLRWRRMNLIRFRVDIARNIPFEWPT